MDVDMLTCKQKKHTYLENYKLNILLLTILVTVPTLTNADLQPLSEPDLARIVGQSGLTIDIGFSDIARLASMGYLDASENDVASAISEYRSSLNV